MDIWEVLVQLIPYYPWIIVVAMIILFIVKLIVNWEKLKPFWRDITNFFYEIRWNIYALIKVNPAIKKAFKKCQECEPIMRVYGEKIIPIRIKIKIKKNIQNVQFIREKGKITALIPQWNVDFLRDALNEHFQKNLRNVSILRKTQKIERALEIFGLKLVVEKMNFNSIMKISLAELLDKMKEVDEDVRLIYDILVNLNNELKEIGIKLERERLMILIVETCRVEFNALGKTLA